MILPTVLLKHSNDNKSLLSSFLALEVSYVLFNTIGILLYYLYIRQNNLSFRCVCRRLRYKMDIIHSVVLLLYIPVYNRNCCYIYTYSFILVYPANLLSPSNPPTFFDCCLPHYGTSLLCASKVNRFMIGHFV